MTQEHTERAYRAWESAFRVAELALKEQPIIPHHLKVAIRVLEPYKRQFRGVISELRARLLIGSLPIVEDVRKATLTEDVYSNDDFYIIYKDDICPDIPLQVKSSKSGVDQFERGGGSSKRDKIVIDFGPQATDEQILERYFIQSAEIRNRMLDKKRELGQDKSSETDCKVGN